MGEDLAFSIFQQAAIENLLDCPEMLTSEFPKSSLHQPATITNMLKLYARFSVFLLYERKNTWKGPQK